jgi:AraC family transcriptional activator of tynA and feaB
MLQTCAETLGTDCVARSDRLRYWNEISASTFGDISVDALEHDFSAQLRRHRFDGLTLASVLSSPARVSGAQTASITQKGWFLLLSQGGTSRMSQESRQVSLGPEEFTALRGDRPFCIEFSRPNRTLVLYLRDEPRGVDLDCHLARRHTQFDTPLLAALLRQLAMLKPNAVARPPDIGRMVVDAAKLCWPMQSDLKRREPMMEWERRVREYVSQNLRDQDLSAASIARRYSVSTRFIHMVFANLGQTAAAYILERKLTAAAARLQSDPGIRVTDVALDCGFADLTGFCHAFRRHFGLSAREYRGRR